jgi:NADPH:quinone reductase-like Zn-dependent oxidoreductase
VGSIAVQLARQHDAYTIAGISSDDAERMMRLGADQVVDTRHSQLTDLPPVDAVIDAAGGDRQRQAMTRLKRGGYIISSVSAPDPQLLKQQDARGSFFLVKTTTRGLRQIANLIDRGVLSTRVGSVLPLEQAQIAHQMLDGIKPYARGKIVLTVTRNNP